MKNQNEFQENCEDFENKKDVNYYRPLKSCKTEAGYPKTRLYEDNENINNSYILNLFDEDFIFIINELSATIKAYHNTTLEDFLGFQNVMNAKNNITLLKISNAFENIKTDFESFYSSAKTIFKKLKKNRKDKLEKCNIISAKYFSKQNSIMDKEDINLNIENLCENVENNHTKQKYQKYMNHFIINNNSNEKKNERNSLPPRCLVIKKNFEEDSHIKKTHSSNLLKVEKFESNLFDNSNENNELINKLIKENYIIKKNYEELLIKNISFNKNSLLICNNVSDYCYKGISTSSKEMLKALDLANIKMEKVQFNFEEITHKNIDLVNENQNLISENTNLASKLQELKLGTIKLESNLNKITKEKEELKKDVEDKNNQINKMNNILLEKIKTIQLISNEKNELNKKINELNEENSKNNDKINKDLIEMDQINKSINTQIKEANYNYSELHKKYNLLIEQNKELTEDINNKNEQLKLLDNKNLINGKTIEEKINLIILEKDKIIEEHLKICNEKVKNEELIENQLMYINELEQEIKNIKDEKNKIDEQNDILIKKIDSKENYIDKINKDLNKKEAKIENLLEEIQAKERIIKNINDEKDTLLNKEEENNKLINIEELGNQQKKLMDELSAKDKKINELNNLLEINAGKIYEMTTNAKELIGENEKLRTEIKELDEENDTLAKEMDSLEKSNNSLKKNKQVLDQKLERFEKEIKEKEGIIEQYKNQKEEQDIKISEIEEKFKNYEIQKNKFKIFEITKIISLYFLRKESIDGDFPIRRRIINSTKKIKQSNKEGTNSEINTLIRKNLNDDLKKCRTYKNKKNNNFIKFFIGSDNQDSSYRLSKNEIEDSKYEDENKEDNKSINSTKSNKVDLTPDNYSIIKVLELKENLKWYLFKKTKKVNFITNEGRKLIHHGSYFRKYRPLNKMNNEDEEYDNYLWMPSKKGVDYSNFVLPKNYLILLDKNKNNLENTSNISDSKNSKVSELETCISELKQKLEKAESDYNRINLNYVKLLNKNKNLNSDKLVEQIQALKKDNKNLSTKIFKMKQETNFIGISFIADDLECSNFIDDKNIQDILNNIEEKTIIINKDIKNDMNNCINKFYENFENNKNEIEINKFLNSIFSLIGFNKNEIDYMLKLNINDINENNKE